MLDAERKYYDEHFDELVQKHPDKVVLIKEQIFVEVFDDMEQALSEGIRRFGLVPYLVRKVGEKERKFFIPAYSLGILQDGNISRSISEQK